GKAVDHRTDIFALGTVLHEMLSGRNPFAGRSTTDSLQKIVNAPPPLNDIPDLPLRVREILMRALARDPAERYQHAGDMQLDLRRAMTAPDLALPAPRRRFGIAGGSALIAGLAVARVASLV